MNWLNRTRAADKPTVKALSDKIHGDFLEKLCNFYEIPYQGNWVVDKTKTPPEVLEAIKDFNGDFGIEKDMLITLASRQAWSGKNSRTFGIANNFDCSATKLLDTLQKHYGNDELVKVSEHYSETLRLVGSEVDDIAKAHGVGSGLPAVGG